MGFYENNKSLGSKIFQGCLIVIFTLLSFICLIPFINIIATSTSSASAIISGKVAFLPVEFTMEPFKKVLANPGFIRSFGYTIFLTLIYTVISMFMTICAAYPLSKRELKGRNVVMTLIIFTMYFDAGIIPHYMIIKNLGLLDNMWVLILPGMLSAYNLIIMRSFFSSIDKSLLESAYLDGCTEIKTLIKIVLPLSTPVLATLSLFYAVSRWNGFSDALYYINNPKLFPLQLKLREIIMMEQVSQQEGSAQASNTVSESIKAASIIISTIPILMVYPFIQKYFTSGIMLGAVKG